MKLGMQIGLGPSHIVLDGYPASLPQRGTVRQFSANICCGQMARWIKMPLGLEIGLGPGDFVLDGIMGPSSPPLGGRGHLYEDEAKNFGLEAYRLSRT